MASQTYYLSSGSRYLSIIESEGGVGLILDDQKVNDLLVYLQNEGILGTTNVVKSVLRPLETFT